MHSPTALTRPSLTYWISLPRLKQGLLLIVQRSYGLMMTLNNSSVNVVASKREPFKENLESFSALFIEKVSKIV